MQNKTTSPHPSRRFSKITITATVFVLAVIIAFAILALWPQQIYQKIPTRPGGPIWTTSSDTILPDSLRVISARLFGDLFKRVATLELDGNHRNMDPIPLPGTILKIQQQEIDWITKQTHLNQLIIKDCDLIGLNTSSFANLNRLQTLFLDSAVFAPDDLAWISKLEYLTSLWLRNFDARHNDLSFIAPLTQIKVIRIDGQGVTDEKLDFLANWHNLEVFKFPDQGLTGRCLLNLKHPEKMIQLILGGAPLDPAFLQALPTFTALSEFEVPNTPFTDDDLKLLTQLPALRIINICNTNVTGDGLKILHGIRTLKKLRITQAFEEKYADQLTKFQAATNVKLDVY